MEANELVAQLETQLKVIARIKERSRVTALPVRETETMVSPNVRMQPGGYNPELTSQSWGENLRVNLPKLQLPVFDGNLQQWHEFWNIYKATIHDQQTLPAVSKFSNLKSLIKGSALSAIAGISLTSENYSSVIKLLQEKFGRKEAIVESLYSKLQNLQRTGNTFADIRWVSETIEKILRQFEAQGEFIDEQRALIQQIISKYPQEVIIKLEETKEPVIPWTVKSLRKAICHYVTVQENVQRYVFTNLKGQPVVLRHTRPLTSALNDSPRPSTSRSSTEVLTANLQRDSHQEGQAKASLPCFFL